MKPTPGTKYGQLDRSRKGIFGNGGVYYPVIVSGHFSRGLMGARVDFPNFPPEYFSNFNTNIFILSYPAMNEAAKNIQGNQSYVTGKFGEQYPFLFQTDVTKKSTQKHIKSLTTSRATTLARFINGQIVLDFSDDYASLI